MSQTRFPIPLIDRFFPSRWTGENGVTRSVDLKTYLEILVRDIEVLCNTRASIPLDPQSERLSTGNTTDRPLTVREWGVPDWTGFSPHSAETVRLLTEAVYNTLEAFEPRLCSISVRQAEEKDAVELDVHRLASANGVCLRVDGRLTAQTPIRVAFLLYMSEDETMTSELRYGF